jgi:hypothetical protein
MKTGIRVGAKTRSHEKVRERGERESVRKGEIESSDPFEPRPGIFLSSDLPPQILESQFSAYL